MMYPHTVTLFSFAGEEDGHAQYAAATLDECRIEGLSGIERALSGEAATGSVRVIVTHRAGLEIKPKDRLSEGEHTELPVDALVVVSAEPLSVGTEAVHHWEVVAK